MPGALGHGALGMALPAFSQAQVMELMSLGTLYHWLEKDSPFVTRLSIALQVAKGMRFFPMQPVLTDTDLHKAARICIAVYQLSFIET